MLRLPKKAFPGFLDGLRKKYQLIAPVQQDILRYKILEEGEQPLFECPPYPPKSFFLPPKEAIFSFHQEQIRPSSGKIPLRIIFLPRCDSNSFLRIDKLYLDEHPDENYRKRRKNTLLFEFFCNKISPHCFCSSMSLTDCFDLKFFEDKDSYYVKVGTEKGRAFLDCRFQKTEEKLFPYQCKKELNLSQLAKLPGFYDDIIWERYAEECLSCAACTSLCPSCCCFDVYDKVKIEDLQAGERKRRWDSCQLLPFTEVAGGHIFQKERGSRLRHRIFHKLVYFPAEYGLSMCTGCGRCLAACPAGIDMLKIINELAIDIARELNNRTKSLS